MSARTHLARIAECGKAVVLHIRFWAIRKLAGSMSVAINLTVSSSDIPLMSRGNILFAVNVEVRKQTDNQDKAQ